MADHTPGPWTIVTRDFEEYWCGDEHYNVGPAVGIKSMADARLIAAASVMLAALKEIAGYPGAVNDDMEIAREIARDAIAKLNP